MRSFGVKRARSEEGVPIAPLHGDLLSTQALLPDGSPAVKEDVERYLLGHAGKDVHAGYGEQWDQDAESGNRDHPQSALSFTLTRFAGQPEPR